MSKVKIKNEELKETAILDIHNVMLDKANELLLQYLIAEEIKHLKFSNNYSINIVQDVNKEDWLTLTISCVN